MKVLVDTSVWSMALRRQASQSAQNERAIVSKLKDLICENQVVLIGPVRQELLSGLRDEASFAKLQSHLASFPDEPLVTEDYEEAARCHNQCRSSGIAGSSVDMLICAAARRRTLTIFTSDEDFRRYEEILDLKLQEE